MGAEYRLKGRIEAGELAELFAAEKDRAEPVVFKLFHPRTSDVRYARETAETARVLNALPHPGIVPIIDIGLVRGRLAVVRKDVEGFTLGLALQRLNTREVILPTSVALALMIELLEIAGRAHQAGVIHGAITPGNILLSKEGRPAFCDFGALRALNAVPGLKKSFGSRGRGSYRGPEVARGEEPDEVADQFSLGAIAYELLTLREPSSGAVSVSVRREALPPPSRLDRRINARLDAIVMRAIEPTPARRFRSCGELAAAFRDFLSSSGGMPARDDLRRFVAELFPSEVSIEPTGPVPFAEPFRLDEVDGADLQPVSEKSMVLPARPSFSGGEAGADSTAETAEGAPGHEEYRAPGGDRPAEMEPTDPGRAGPLEHGWEAPPGAAPAKRKAASGAHQAGAAARPAMRRLRVIEDFAGAKAGVDLEAEAPAEKQQEQAWPSATPNSSGFAAVPAPDTSQASSDPRFQVTDPDGTRRRMITEERNLFRSAVKRRRMLFFALAIAMVGVAILTVVLVELSRRGKRKDPGVASVERAISKYLQSEPPPLPPRPPPRPIAPPPAVEAPAEPAAEPQAPPRKGAGFLTIRSDVPAAVYVDGQLVRKQTPLSSYPLAPGRRKIALVEGKTGERREFTVNIVKGKTLKIEEQFGSRRP
ncbi:MAG: protein kinase [Myxococcales bacterium]|nr:protein kinase [Myxococcales bacterium]